MLDTAIGLVGIYVFLSLICTTVKELIAQFTSQRAETLLTGLRRLLDGEFAAKNTVLRWFGGVEGKISLSDLGDGSLVKKLYDHHLIRSHAEGGEKPSHIPAETFATALLDILDSEEDAKTIESIRESIKDLPEDLPVRSALLSILSEVGDDLDAFREGLKTWYNNSMDRVSSFYKKHTQLAVFFIAVLTVGLTNADTFQMVRMLGKNDVLREAAVQQARNIVQSERLFPEMANASGSRPLDSAAVRSDSSAPRTLPARRALPPRRALPARRALPDSAFLDSLVNRTEQYVGSYRTLGLPVGWGSADLPSKGSTAYEILRYWVSKGLGLLLTALAISLGAPFWFGVLEKISTVRSSGRSSPER